MKMKMKKQKSKGANENFIIPTNEFMQIFMLTQKNYKMPIVNSNEIFFIAEKEIDEKAKIQIRWELLHFFNDSRVKLAILKNFKSAIKNPTVNSLIRKVSTFSREEIIIYLILFNHYIENKEYWDNEKNIVITMKDIHVKYRNKTLKMFSQIDTLTLKSYKKALKILSEKTIYLNTDTCKKNIKYIFKKDILSFTDKLLNYTKIEDENGNLTAIKYNLGKFGNFLLTSKRLTSKFPHELIEKPYNQIGQVFMGLYITKLLFINQKKKDLDSGLSISIQSVLKNIMVFDVKGNSTNMTLFEKLKGSTKQKYSLIKTFNKNLIDVLDLYKKHGYIKNYYIDEINILNYDSKSTKIKLIIK